MLQRLIWSHAAVLIERIGDHSRTELGLLALSGSVDLCCPRSRKDLLCKKNKSNQGKDVEDHLARRSIAGQLAKVWYGAAMQESVAPEAAANR